MSLPKVPNYSKGQIDRAGDALLKNESDEKAQLILSEWRACHAYPINTFQSTLRDKVAALHLKNTLVAQRLKRLPTIIDKLRRYPDMKLSRMQDIGGVRVVLETISDVRKIENSYRVKSANSRFEHKLVGEKDYIKYPRSEDGYRSVHLIYSYKNRVASQYEGLRIEMQIRTKLQHIWATSVETMGTYLNQPLKSRLGKKEWLDFFALVSSAFAYMESMPLVPRFAHMTKIQTYEKVAKAEYKLQVLEKLTGFAAAAKIIQNSKRHRFYHLIILDTDKKTIELKSFAKDDFENAQTEYSKAERRAIEGEKIEPVLVAAGSMVSLKRAYPNFFLDTTEFVNKVREIINKLDK